jgi:hypothetical protein
MLEHPLFLVSGWWHPFTLFLRLVRLGAVASTTPYAIALLTFGVVTSLIAIRRQRFAVTTLVLTLAILGTNWFYFVVFLIALAIGVVLLAIRRPGLSPAHIIEAIASLIIAMLLAAPWLLPAYMIGRERASPTSFDSRLFERIRPYAVGRQPAASCFLPDAALVGGTADSLERLTNLRELATVDHVPAKITNLSGGRLRTLPGQRLLIHGAGGDAVVRRADRELVVDVDARGWDLLVTSVPWWDGWRVYANGDRYPPVVVNTAFVGSFVPPGHTTLVFRYQPAYVRTGLRFTLLGVVLFFVTLRFPWVAFVARYARLPRFERRSPERQRERRGISRLFSLPSMPSMPLWSIVLPLFIAYAAVLITHRVDVAGGADSSGYLNQSRQWIKRELRAPLPLAEELAIPPQSEGALIPLGYVHATTQRHMVPSYPPGLPLQMALMRIIAGESGAFFLVPLLAIAGVLLMYRLLRDLAFTPRWSSAGAAMLAICPIWIYHGIQPMSDVVAGVWAIATMLCAFRGANDARFAALAGICLGIGVLTRPTQILLFPAIVCAIGLFNRRSLIALVACGAPFALAQMAISGYLYGHPLMTGYGSVLSELRWSYFAPRFLHYSFWLAAIVSPIGFPTGFFSLTRRDVELRLRLALALWFVPFFLFYCFYGPYETWWYTRFLVPAIPSLIILALFLLTRVPRVAGAIVMLAIFALQLGVANHFDVLDFGEGERIYPDAAAMAMARVPRDAVIVTMQHSGSLYYYAGRLSLRYDVVPPELFAAIRKQRRIFALLADFEVAECRRRTSADGWVPIARVRDVGLYELR